MSAIAKGVAIQRGVRRCRCCNPRNNGGGASDKEAGNAAEEERFAALPFLFALFFRVVLV
jgi:hypothetical protein